MSLRWKLPLIVLIFAVLYTTAVGGVFALRVAPSFDALDESATRDALDRVEELVRREAQSVGVLSADYGQWDHAYAHVADPTSDFIEEHVVPETLHESGIDFAAMVANDGTVVWSWPNKTLPFDLQQFIAGGEPALATKAGLSGLVDTPLGLAVVAASLITDSLHELPPRGWFVFGRLLSPERVAGISRSAPVPFSLTPSADAIVGPTQIRWAGQDQVEGSKTLTSPSGRAVATVHLTREGSAGLRGRAVAAQALGTVGVAGVAMASLLALSLQLMLVHPLARLGEQLRQIREGTLESALVYTRDDELGRLVGQINRAMDGLRTAERDRAAGLRALDVAHGRLGAEVAAREASEKLRESEALQNQAMRLQVVGQLAGGVAHDFNNILQAIHGSAQFLMDEPENLEVVRDESRIILRETDRAATLVKQLSAFSRRGHAESKPVDLVRLVRQVGSLLRRTLPRHVRLRTHLTATRVVVQGDVNQLRSALLNLALNARDAMPDGGVLLVELSDALSPAVPLTHLQPAKADGLVRLVVSDTGVGISDSARAHLFEPFFTTKADGEGTGLGLAAVYGIAQRHNAGLDVHSTLGVGTSFSLVFPAEVGELDVLREDPPSMTPGHQILFVDDEPSVCRMASRILRGLGHRVVVAEDGLKAVQAYDGDGPFDLVILDAMMPRLDGFATLRQLLARDPSLRVIFQSGGTLDPENDTRTKDLVRAYLPKPYTAAALTELVAQVLRAP